MPHQLTAELKPGPWAKLHLHPARRETETALGLEQGSQKLRFRISPKGVWESGLEAMNGSALTALDCKSRPTAREMARAMPSKATPIDRPGQGIQYCGAIARGAMGSWPEKWRESRATRQWLYFQEGLARGAASPPKFHGRWGLTVYNS